MPITRTAASRAKLSRITKNKIAERKTITKKGKESIGQVTGPRGKEIQPELKPTMTRLTNTFTRTLPTRNGRSLLEIAQEQAKTSIATKAREILERGKTGKALRLRPTKPREEIKPGIQVITEAKAKTREEQAVAARGKSREQFTRAVTGKSTLELAQKEAQMEKAIKAKSELEREKAAPSLLQIAKKEAKTPRAIAARTALEKEPTQKVRAGFTGIGILGKAAPVTKKEKIIRGEVQPAKIGFFEEKIEEPLARAERKGGLIGLAAFPVAAGVAFGKTTIIEPGKFAFQLFTRPKETIFGTAAGIKELAVSPVARQRIGLEIGRTFKERPGMAIGTAAGLLLGPLAVTKLTKVARTTAPSLLVKGVAKVTRKKPIPAEKVISPVTPTVKTTEEALKRFAVAKESTGKITVVTAAPQPLKGTVAGPGRKGVAGLEDPGIYVTPKGEASKMFLRLQTGEEKIRFSLLPEIKGFERPAITEFQVAKVRKLPQQVLEKPGFAPVKEFFEKRPKLAEAFLTKRGMIGRGEIPLREFKATGTEGPLPIAKTVRREDKIFKFKAGERLKKGDILREAGTRELEAVIPAGTPFIKAKPESLFEKITGFREFTLVEGRAIGIRRVEIPTPKPRVDEGVQKLINPSKFAPKPKKISIKRLRKEQEALESLSGIKAPTTTLSPIGTGARISRLISRPARAPKGVSIITGKLTRDISRVFARDISKPFPPPTDISKPITPPSGISIPAPGISKPPRQVSGISIPAPGISKITPPKPPKKIIRPKQPKPEPRKKLKRLIEVKRRFEFTPTLLGISAKKKRMAGIDKVFTGIEIRGV